MFIIIIGDYMGDLLNVSLKTAFFYFFIVFVYRLMGKREVGQLGIIDLIVSNLIAELVAISIENLSKPITHTIFPILVLVILEISLAFVSVKSRKVRSFFGGKPSIIINKGVINYQEMIKQRYTIDDLLLQLRQQNVKSIEEIEYAFLENNGKLSIFKYNFLGLPGNFPLPIIVDGEIQHTTLKNIYKSEKWVRDTLTKEGLKPEDIFYAFYKKNKMYIIKH